MAKGGRKVRIFSALEVANICGVVNQTTINWIRNGHLKAFTTPGGQYRIYAKDLAAFLDKRGMEASGEVLQVIMENANWGTFLIALPQPINDTVKAELSRIFPGTTIIQAFDWFEIGRKFTEEKPGLVILDAELPGVDIGKFVTVIKEDPIFGKPHVFLVSDGSPGPAGSEPNDIRFQKADVILKKPLDLAKLEAALRVLEKQAAAVNA
ncbi:MAG: helix-turn-helix domain-containing protein [Treponema sp.]|nr:helix-turn-helix domain-containing protein [Treponema sp.]